MGGEGGDGGGCGEDGVGGDLFLVGVGFVGVGERGIPIAFDTSVEYTFFPL